MHTPQAMNCATVWCMQPTGGHHINPSMPYRFTHMLLHRDHGGLSHTGISALRLLMSDKSEKREVNPPRRRVAWRAAHSRTDLCGRPSWPEHIEHQPQKVAAMEGNWETKGNVPLLLFAVPSEADEPITINWHSKPCFHYLEARSGRRGAGPERLLSQQPMAR